ncbi:hypothetical protein PENTCL1PPCAC_7905, partial [Pristionchus entomophagus]
SLKNFRYRFNSVYPEIILIHSEETRDSGLSVKVQLANTTEEEQALCQCPPFLLDTLTFRIDPACPPMDCLWKIPKFGFGNLNISSTSDEMHESLYLITSHRDDSRTEQLFEPKPYDRHDPWQNPRASKSGFQK